MAGKKRPTKQTWKKILAGIMGATILGTGAIAYKNLPYFIGEKVVEVVDGDTIIIENRQPIRLYGLNAPELQNYLGDKAKDTLTSLVLNKKVILREPLSDGRGRVMALVYQNGRLINEIMIKSGLAQYRRQGGSETIKLSAANDYARKNKIGIYSSMCYQTESPNSKCIIKGNYNDQNGTRFYFQPSCRFYNLVIIEKHQGDEWFCTERQARAAGFSKSPNCE